MADEIVASRERGKWHGVRDELTGNVCITNPAGTKYEISAPRLAQLDRGAATLLNDTLDSLFDLQNENEALRARDALRDRAEGQAAFEVVAQLEAAKAERAADKAGFEAVIRELREEVAALKERQLAAGAFNGDGCDTAGALVAAIQAKIQSKGDFPLVEFYESLDCDKDEWFLSEEQLAEIAMKAFGKWLKGEQ